MRNAFPEDRLECETCGGNGDLPGNPARMRLAAFAGHEPARRLLARQDMPGKTVLEHHGILPGINLMNYTFGVIPAFSGLLAVAYLRVGNERYGDPDSPTVGLARMGVDVCRSWRDDPRNLELVPKLIPEGHVNGLWWGPLVGVTCSVAASLFPEDYDRPETIISTPPDFRELILASRGVAANETLSRIGRAMAKAYPKIVGPDLNDWECWKTFKLGVIKWALGEAYQ